MLLVPTAQLPCQPHVPWRGRIALQAAEEVEAEVEEAAQTVAKPFASLFGGKPKQVKKFCDATVCNVQRRVAIGFSVLHTRCVDGAII